MDRKKRWLYLSLIGAAGLAGGALSSIFIQAGAAFGATHHYRHALKSVTVQTLAAHTIVLLDKSGKKRAELHMVNDQPELEMLATDGKVRVSLAVGQHGVARARFYNANGDPQAALGVTADGRPALALMDKSRNLRATVDTSQEGAPSMRLFGRKGPLVGLNVTSEGVPGMALLNQDGKTLAALDVTSEGRSALTLYDASGNVVAGLP